MMALRRRPRQPTPPPELLEFRRSDWPASDPFDEWKLARRSWSDVREFCVPGKPCRSKEGPFGDCVGQLRAERIAREQADAAPLD